VIGTQSILEEAATTTSAIGKKVKNRKLLKFRNFEEGPHGTEIQTSEEGSLLSFAGVSELKRRALGNWDPGL
jgi:hypothetical protein